jgi:hypothetical protein
MKDVDRTSLIGFLEAMDRAAEDRQTICVMGAAALILLGQPERQTGDIDVWRPGSQVLDSDLRRLAAESGLSYDPKEYEPEGAYLQIINPGIVNLPAVRDDTWATGEDSLILWQGRKLTVVCPPPPIIAASKLVRASEVDIDDVVYLIGAIGVSRKQILQAADKFPDADRETIRENMPMVDATLPVAERRAQKRKSREDPER